VRGATIPHRKLNKRHLILSWHYVRQAIAPQVRMSMCTFPARSILPTSPVCTNDAEVVAGELSGY